MKELLIEAHRKAALRDSSSTVILKAAFDSNGGDLIKSITAAMMTLGGLHAPIKHVYSMLNKMNSPNGDYFCYKKLDPIPGFGSSFVSTKDPILEDLNDHIFASNKYSRIHEYKRKIESHLFETKNKSIYPNIAFYTAAYALVEEKSILFCESILLEARMPVWIEILKAHYESQKES